MAMFQESLENLKNIAQADHLSKHVKKLTFFCDILPDFGTIEEYARSLKQKQNFRSWHDSGNRELILGEWQLWQDSPAFSLSSHDVEGGWEAYERLRHEQEDWTVAREGLVLADTLCRLPSLSEANVTCGSYSTKDESNGWPLWRRLRKSMYMGPADWIFADDRGEGFTETSSVNAVLSLLEGLAARSNYARFVEGRTTKLSLVTGVQDSCQSARSQSYDKDLPFNLDRTSHAFDYVVDLRIHIMDAIRFMKTRKRIQNELSIFLRRAQMLKRLELLLKSTHHEGEVILYPKIFDIYPEIFDSNTIAWPQIQSLSLMVDIPSKVLLNFLALHAATIKELRLEHMVLGDVPFLLERIPSILHLQAVYLHDVYHCGVRRPGKPHELIAYLLDICGSDGTASYETALRAWLLGRSGLMPDLSQDGLGHRKVLKDKTVMEADCRDI
ncbi:hypothetical protein DOTSEDRAFT_69059 [Dothistroma septosporum NZE10]|uniref:Uncharacterized protein n=1 Tax=Dothistroma septosporum (strain NZE10 / CBS 128990) TaxID=675120 RepID=N1Q5I5_DOTSN|nr:hypothetical protein DOTSEDRAFT_69059 [Dothistroma septosporum NZE10]